MFNQKRLLAASAVLLGAAALGSGVSFAQSGSAKVEPARFEIGSDASFADVRARLADQGFTVLEVEYDDRKIEVKGTDPAGQCTEIYFDPASGRELRREGDDDCGGQDNGLSNDDRWGD